MSKKFTFSVHKTDSKSKARRGEFVTSHGRVQTPIFMPVGTLATVKTLSPEELQHLDAQIILGNTYHLLLRPGPEVFQKFGGIHRFMNWQRPVLTDSGGFQIFSLPRARKMTEEGAVFQSYVEGDTYRLTPESSIAMQQAIGSDIMMVLDECINSTSDHQRTREAMELTHRWAVRSLEAHRLGEQNLMNQNKGILRAQSGNGQTLWKPILSNPLQALFGIVQGGVHEDLRRESARVLTQLDFDGFAIGGLAVGETKAQREDFTELVTSLLPQEKPRYLMGVGTPVDLLEAVKRGIDMFDCIIPTKLAQQGVVYTSRGEVKLASLDYKFDDDPVDAQCECHTCRTYSRGYLHHLTKCRESLGWRALSYHNVYFFLSLMEKARLAIEADQFMEFYKTTLEAWREGAVNAESGGIDHDLTVEFSREAAEMRKPATLKNPLLQKKM